MATASNATTSAGETSGNNVPQWKRDLIQRRRQQNKVLANNGASVKLCSAVIGGTPATTTTNSTTDAVDPSGGQEQCLTGNVSSRTRTASTGEESSDTVNSSSGNGGSGGSAIAGVVVSSCPFFSRGPACGAIVSGGTIVATEVAGSTVACNMRLEADLSFCSDSEDVANGTLSKPTDTERKSEHGDGSENEDGKSSSDPLAGCEEHRVTTGGGGGGGGGALRGTNKVERDVLMEVSKSKTGKIETEMARNRGSSSDDGESDSSEELQYGPGIVNKLKSKYLNLTLREMNKSRVSVQRFRRAASLEDLLDCEEESSEKSARKYAKRATTGAATKTDRYRNASRGNESMKRARSVETLLRYNGADEVAGTRGLTGRVAANGLKQEPVNDHIILIDRTTVKIESRLGELDRPKAVNKPKRIKPLLAETERPPPDLVKTTMRIFEGSAKKLKPKGEVAAKVATFKTINDTFKAQSTQKKMVTKPPVQPKPFVNGNSRTAGSPKKIVLPQKPTAELIETQEEFHFDGVITDPIVQSVSSVVSKFQQIEKSHSPSPSPEPSFKFKFSPAPSPEPQLSKFKSSLEISVKSPPVTPVLSPRIPSPRLHSPSSPMKENATRHSPPSPMKELPRQNSSPVHKPPPSPSRELLRQMSLPSSEPSKFPRTDETTVNNTAEHPRQQRSPERIQSPAEREKLDEPKFPVDPTVVANDDELAEEEVDAPKTISKAALENIARTGVTMQFSFNDKPASNKSYLPGFKQNGQKATDEQPDARNETKPSESRGKSFLSDSSGNETGNDTGNVAVTEQETVVSRLQERLETDKRDRKIEDSKEDTDAKVNVDNKPIGAICSLGLIKSSTITSYPQGNDSKTIRCQKSNESPPQKQIGIIRPLVSTKTQHPQQNLSNRELEKNLINRVKSIEQPTKVVVSLKSADEIQPAKKTGSGGAGLWETKPWNQQNNTMVFNFSNRKDVPDYIENDGLIIKRKREKPKVGDGGIIVLDATLDASTTDDAEWELTGGPPSPCDVSFFNDNVLINGRSNLSRTPRNHKHRIQFDDTATRTFEYPSEASMLEGESSVDGDTSGSDEQSPPITNKTSSSNSTTSLPTLLGGGGGLASYTPSKVDLTSEGFELGVTSRAVSSTPLSTQTSTPTTDQAENETDVDYLKPAQDAGAWGSETTGDLLY
ncbi:protein phosphatase 1-binding protein bifocal isoform X1 [Osmia lignaria lignaria]|uniref:protein phosphatase 1-binding protein bifocal isoform X1 n=1 Tax=Osmia lignaria lignaria TaxID=1437193 RepID=UPI00402BC416